RIRGDGRDKSIRIDLRTSARGQVDDRDHKSLSGVGRLRDEAIAPSRNPVLMAHRIGYERGQRPPRGGHEAGPIRPNSADLSLLPAEVVRGTEERTRGDHGIRRGLSGVEHPTKVKRRNCGQKTAHSLREKTVGDL